MTLVPDSYQRYCQPQVSSTPRDSFLYGLYMRLSLTPMCVFCQEERPPCSAIPRVGLIEHGPAPAAVFQGGGFYTPM